MIVEWRDSVARERARERASESCGDEHSGPLGGGVFNEESLRLERQIRLIERPRSPTTQSTADTERG